MLKKKELCPVCENFTFSAIDSHEKCPICGWINDQFQQEHPFVGRGSNYFSLAQQQKAWKILNLEYEVGYGNDNLYYEGSECGLCKEKVCVDECYCKVKLLLEGKLPEGVTDLDTARDICAKCLFEKNAEVEDMRRDSSMVDKPCGWEPYGSGVWGCGSDEYDLEENKKYLKSLIKYRHGKQNYVGADFNQKPDATYAEVKDQLLPLMAADEQGRRNFESYFYRPLLSIRDFILYALNEQGILDHCFSLCAFGAPGEEEQGYEFTPEEKENAQQVLHLSLSFLYYKCTTFGEPGLYYLDNRYEYWKVEDFEDTIAAWFVAIGDDLQEKDLLDMLRDILRYSFAFSHVKLALYLAAHLDFAKTNPEIQTLAQLYCKVPSLRI